MSNNSNAVKVTTPRVTFGYPHLNTPDTKFDKDGKYTTKAYLAADDDATVAFQAKLEAIRDEFLKAKVAELTAQKKGGLAKEITAADVLHVEKDPETGDETGRLYFSASTKAGGIVKNGPRAGQPWSRKLDIFNAQGVQLKNPPDIGSGTVGKLTIEVEAFLKPETKKVGLSLRLMAAQIITLKSFGARSASDYGFGTEDGDDIADGAAPSGQFTAEDVDHDDL